MLKMLQCKKIHLKERSQAISHLNERRTKPSNITPQGTKNEAKQYHTSRNEERSQAISQSDANVKLINMLKIKVAESTQTAMNRSQRYK